MNTFQLLKSGANFAGKHNSPKKTTHSQRFEGNGKSQNSKPQQKEGPDRILPALDKEIEAAKEKIAQVKQVSSDILKKKEDEVLKEKKNAENKFKNDLTGLKAEIQELDEELEEVQNERAKKLASAEDELKSLSNRRRERLIQIQKQHRIKIEGDRVPELLDSFEKMKAKYGLSAQFMQLLKNSSIIRPTPVQMQSVPVLFEKRDSIILAETGSGKSLAFITPLVHMHQRGDGLKAVIVAPTRELAIQLYKEFLMFTQNTGFTEKKDDQKKKKKREAKADEKEEASKAWRPVRVKFLRKALVPKDEEQFEQFCKSCEILISTPLKLAQLTEKFQFTTLEHLVIDEADKMFEMGFLEQIDTILSNCKHSARISKFMFSATMQPCIEETVREIMAQQPVKIQIGIKNSTASTVEQKLIYTGNEDAKLQTLRQLIADGYKPPMLIFVQSKDRAKQLFKELKFDGVNVEVIHADKKKEERDTIIKEFRVGKVWILICTDLMSRGIDFKTVNEVVNFDFPQSLVSYIHRIGRTGRAGRKGKASTFFTDEDKPFVKTIANLMKKSGDQEVPEWMLKLKSCSNKEWKKIEKKPLRRKVITTRERSEMPKKFMKKMEKNMRRAERQGKITAQNQAEGDDGEEFEEVVAGSDDGGFEEVVESGDEYVEDE